MSLRPLLVLAIAIVACKPTTTTPPPATPPRDDGGPPGDEHTFVSTSNNERREAAKESGGPDLSGYAVTTPDAVRELAQAAIADRLDPKRTWKTSPVLPATWPVTERAVMVFYYPMSANPRSMVHFQLFSAAFGVKVSLVDGATSIQPIAKSREIGTIEESRPSSLERRELDLAEVSLVHQLLGAEIDSEETPYWGYLKYMHEHPQLGKDLQRRAPAFLGWVRKRYGK